VKANQATSFSSSDEEVYPLQEQVSDLLQLSKNFSDSSYQKSLEIGWKAIQLAEKSGKGELKGKAYKAQGVVYLKQGILDSALNYFNRAIPEFTTSEMRLEEGQTRSNIGVVYRRRGLFDKALENYIKVVQIYDGISYQKGIGGAYLNIGGLYHRMQKFAKTEEYYLRALRIFQKLEIDEYIARALNNLGVLHEQLENYEESLKYYQEALEMNEKIGNQQLQGLLRMNIGQIFFREKKYDQAMAYYNVAEDIRTSMADNWGLIRVWVLKAKCYDELGEGEKALALFQKAEQMAKKGNLTPDLESIYYELSEFYERKKDLTNAFKYFKEANILSDSLKIANNTEQMQELEAKFEADTQRKDLALLSQKNKIQSLEIGKKNAWLFGLVTLILLGVVAIGVSFRINRIRAEHRIMSLQQKVLLTQMNPHFLFNSLTAIQSFILDEKNMEANNYLSQLASLVRGVLENSRQEFIALRSEMSVLKDYMDMQNLRFDDQLAFHIEVDEDIDQDEIAVPPMLAQPFIENAIKHGELRNNPDSEIRIKISLDGQGDTVLFEISDNGVGIEQSMEKSRNSKHRSLATSIALDRVKIYNMKEDKRMKFEIVDLKNIHPELHGTRVTFHIPCKRM
jgi:tetratricopeptide (TPR) repeat protein